MQLPLSSYLSTLYVFHNTIPLNLMASKHGAVWQSDPKPQRLRFYILYFLQVPVYLITTSLVKRYFQLLAQKRESTLFVLLNEIFFTFVKYYILFFFRI